MTNKEKPAKDEIDWEIIERDFRAGIKSVLQIGKEHDISHTAINKRFKKLGVSRDLKAKIKAKAEAMVSAAAVSTEVSTETKPRDVEIIEANATLQANALLDHRKDIKRHRTLAMKLLAEIEAETDSLHLFEKLGEMLEAPDDKGVDKLNELYRKVISTPSRVDSMKKLSETLKNLIAMERQALGLDDVDPEGDKPTSLTDEQVNARLSALLHKARTAA